MLLRPSHLGSRDGCCVASSDFLLVLIVGDVPKWKGLCCHFAYIWAFEPAFPCSIFSLPSLWLGTFEKARCL